MSSNSGTKRNCFVHITFAVLHVLALAAVITVIYLRYCPSFDGMKHCKKNDETDEEYAKRNVTSWEKQECDGTI